MRCQCCEFENMPGMQKCMRCGSALTAMEGPLQVDPPRMAGWKKPLRGLLRRLRTFVPVSAWSGDDLQNRHFPDWIIKFSRVSFFGVIISFIPGLAHLIQKRFHSIRWWVMGWFVLIMASFFLYGSLAGMILIGLTIGLHVWIAVHSALLDEYDEFGYRMTGYFIILAFYFIAYLGLGNLIFYNIDGGYSIVNVPGAQVSHGDFLLGSRSQIQTEDLIRGSFVFTHLTSVGGNRFRRTSDMAFVQIVGLPGETVKIDNGVYVVNEEILDTELFPVPSWLKHQNFSTAVPKASYFISAQYHGTGYNQSQAISVCTVSQNQIEAKAFMRWMPLRNRGFIQDSE